LFFVVETPFGEFNNNPQKPVLPNPGEGDHKGALSIPSAQQWHSPKPIKQAFASLCFGVVDLKTF
jgi:hypothetical protein